MNWEQLTNILNKELNKNESSSAYRKPYQNAKKYKEEVFISDDYIEDLNEVLRALKIEKAKLQTEKLENNKWLRELARDELITEKIVSAIENLKPLTIPKTLLHEEHKNRDAVFCFGDAHYGAECKIIGIDEKVINEYSPEIFCYRMEYILNELKNIIAKENIEHLYVYELGDCADGILRVSQLMKLRYGVVESTIKYADYISTWLNELSKYVNITFQMVGGNHTELRMLGQPKGTFTEDNMSKVVAELIKIRLKNNPNFTFKENPSGYIVDTIQGYNIFGFHGDTKNLEQAVNDFSNIYNYNIDYLICGHCHHASNNTIGINKEVITAPSIMGVDDYALKIGKTSTAGATLFFLEKGLGKTLQYNINTFSNIVH